MRTNRAVTQFSEVAIHEDRFNVYAKVVINYEAQLDMNKPILSMQKEEIVKAIEGACSKFVIGSLEDEK